MAEYQTKNFINGQYVSSSDAKKLSIYNPTDDSLVTDSVEIATQAQVDAAVDAAQKAFPAWRARSSHDRAAIMLKFADLLEKNADKLGRLESVAMGQPISEAGGCHDYGEFVLKSSEKAPLGLAAYGDLLNEAGFPPGVINVVAGDGSVGAMLSSHMQIARIAFTGSLPAGRAVMAASARSNLKVVSLELGGKSPAIIFEDADVPNAIHHNSTSFLLNSGQICYASSRLFVHEKIAPQFIEGIKKAFEDATDQMGDPSSEDTFYGPLADKKQFESVMGYLTEAEKEGVEVIVGGKRKGDKGTFVLPTILLNPDVKAKVWTNEIFGPVLTIRTFSSEEEVIALANDTAYGLGSVVYTNDISRAMRVANKIEAGAVGINAPYWTDSSSPIGGYKQSGIGRESGHEGMKEYLQSKTIQITLSPGK